MTNKELIEKLLKYPLATAIHFEDINFGGSYESLEKEDFWYDKKRNCILISSPVQDYID
jgi:hypothetical protein